MVWAEAGEGGILLYLQSSKESQKCLKQDWPDQIWVLWSSLAAAWKMHGGRSVKWCVGTRCKDGTTVQWPCIPGGHPVASRQCPHGMRITPLRAVSTCQTWSCLTLKTATHIIYNFRGHQSVKELSTSPVLTQIVKCLLLTAKLTSPLYSDPQIEPFIHCRGQPGCRFGDSFPILGLLRVW